MRRWFHRNIVRGNLDKNVAIHAAYARLVLEYRSDVIIFPEPVGRRPEPDIAITSSVSIDDPGDSFTIQPPEPVSRRSSLP